MTKKSSNNRSRNRGGKDDLSPYKGPVRLDNTEAQPRLDRINLMRVIGMSSSAGGDLLLNSGPSTVSLAADWGNFAAIYKEYRVVAIEARYLPDFVVNATGAISKAGATAISHVGGVAAPATLSEVVAYDNWENWHSAKPFTRVFRARGAEELQWGPTSATNDTGSVIGFIGGVTPSIQYGQMVWTYVVEFRNRY